LIHKLVIEKNLGIILVSHALGMVNRMTDRVYVLYAGDVMEAANTSEIMNNPRHPYTQLLISSTPRLSSVGVGEGIKGKLPDYRFPTPGCRFAPRCPYAMQKCFAAKPGVTRLNNNHLVACYLYE
jgi:peptide/nickel transport system ATP-binding protein